MEKSEEKIRSLRNTVKSSNICIIGTPELKNREHVEKAIFGEFTAKKLPKPSKIIKTEIQEVLRIQLG